MVWKMSQILEAQVAGSAALLDFSKAFDNVPYTHMLFFVQPTPGDPVQHLSTNMYPA